MKTGPERNANSARFLFYWQGLSANMITSTLVNIQLF